MNDIDCIYNYLNRHCINYSTISHQPINTINEGIQFAHSLGFEPSKCLLLVNRQHQYYMIIARGNGIIDLQLLAQQINSSRLSFVSIEDLKRMLHTLPGAVSPLELIFDEQQHINFIVDNSLLATNGILLASGINTVSIIMTPQELLNKFLPATSHSYTIVTL